MTRSLNTSTLGCLIGLVAVTAMVVNSDQSETQLIPDSEVVKPTTSASNTDKFVYKAIPNQALQTELQQLRQKLALKQAMIDQQREEMARLSTQPTDSDSSASNWLEEDMDPLLEADDSAEQSFAEANMALLDETLDSEVPDPVWSGMATSKINELLTSEDFSGSELIETSCGATLCRVETWQEDPDAAEQFLDKSPFLIGWDGNAYAQVINHDEGDQSIVYYLSRAGYQLPRADG